MSPIASTSSGSAAATSGQTSQTGQNSSDDYQTMFLQLLVAQLQNQDPLNPVDGTAFVTQLAQMQQVQQSINTGQAVSSILEDANQLVSDLGGTSSSTGSSPVTQP